MERHLAVILAADVVGYSHLMEVDEERTHEAFRSCHDLIANLISRHRGRIFAGAGDSVLAEFASTLDAVRAAVDIHGTGRAFLRSIGERADEVSHWYQRR